MAPAVPALQEWDPLSNSRFGCCLGGFWGVAGSSGGTGRGWAWRTVAGGRERGGLAVDRRLLICLYVPLLCLRRGGGAGLGAPLTQTWRERPVGTFGIGRGRVMRRCPGDEHLGLPRRGRLKGTASACIHLRGRHFFGEVQQHHFVKVSQRREDEVLEVRPQLMPQRTAALLFG